MSQYGWQNCPLPVRTQVVGLSNAIYLALRRELVGFYLHGSLAMGCFNPDRSDVDCLAVTEHPLSTSARHEVARAVVEFSNAPCPVEISVVNLLHLVPWRHPAPYDFHFSESLRPHIQAELNQGTGPSAPAQPATDPDLAAHLTVTRTRSVTLYGMPADLALPNVPSADFLDSISRDFAWARERLDSNPVYFILNTCRVLAFLMDGRMCSKEEGGVWGVQSLPIEFRDTVLQALQIYRGYVPDQPVDSGALEALAAYAAAEIELPVDDA